VAGGRKTSDLILFLQYFSTPFIVFFFVCPVDSPTHIKCPCNYHHELYIADLDRL